MLSGLREEEEDGSEDERREEAEGVLVEATTYLRVGARREERKVSSTLVLETRDQKEQLNSPSIPHVPLPSMPRNVSLERVNFISDFEVGLETNKTERGGRKTRRARE